MGSNLSLRLLELGSRVTVVDSKTPGCGANECNIEAVRGQVRLIVGDIGEAAEFAGLLSRADVMFDLAGEISHTHSMRFPERDGDSSHIRREPGWMPATRLAEGHARTLSYYEANPHHYLDPGSPEPRCALGEQEQPRRWRCATT